MLALSFAAPAAHSEVVPGTTLSIDFQSALIHAGGRKIDMYRIPVTDTTSGTTTFYDAAFNFTIDADGLKFERANYAVSSTVQATSVQNIIEGTYKDAGTTLYSLTRSTGLSGGRDLYTLRAENNGVFSASYATGLLANHPIILSTTTRANCGALEGGLYGMNGTNNMCPAGVGTSNYCSNATATRIRQLDSRHIEYATINSSCGAMNSIILTKN